MADSTISSGYVKQLPTKQISLKTIDFNDTVVAGAGTSNANFIELQRLLNIFNGAIQELASNVDVDVIINNVIQKLETIKKMFNIRYSLPVSATEQVTFFNRIYTIERLDEKNFKITRVLGDDSVDWDTSGIICQLKNHDGIISYANIATLDNSIVVMFDEAPSEDYILYCI